jgi:hypothetical protein
LVGNKQQKFQSLLNKEATGEKKGNTIVRSRTKATEFSLV